MSRRSTAPKHRASRTTSLIRTLKRQSTLAGIAVAITGVAVSVGVAATADRPPTTRAAALMVELNASDAETTLSADEIDDLTSSRESRLSRSDRRTAVDRTKARLLAQETESGGQVTRTEDLGSQDPKLVAQALLPEFGFSADQFSCLDALWTKESGWNAAADNPTSSAYGIPQALPGSKMASAGPDWATNPATQVRWGLGYIADAYGTPCSAWSHSQANNWY
jgi:hypothetical protein